MGRSLRGLYLLLARQVDPGEWWPASSRFEVAVGAVLTQNTAWSNVQRAIDNLRQAGLLSARQILSVDQEALADLIRPSGYYRTKSAYLKNLAAWYLEYDHQAERMDTFRLRESLLQVRGIGSETADDLLLYLYDRPIFIYDLYARRLLAAAGFGNYRTYEQAKT